MIKNKDRSNKRYVTIYGRIKFGHIYGVGLDWPYTAHSAGVRHHKNNEQVILKEHNNAE